MHNGLCQEHLVNHCACFLYYPISISAQSESYQQFQSCQFSFKDQLSADMYNFFSKEADYARHYVMVRSISFFIHGFNNSVAMYIPVQFHVFSTHCSFCRASFLPQCLLCSQLLEAQADYHRKSLTLLESVLPTIQAQQGDGTVSYCCVTEITTNET